MGKQCKGDSAIVDLGRANHYRLAVPVTCAWAYILKVCNVLISVECLLPTTLLDGVDAAVADRGVSSERANVDADVDYIFVHYGKAVTFEPTKPMLKAPVNIT